MSKYALLFSGQGAQKVGMGKDWFEHSATARSMVAAADAALGTSLSEVMFEGPEEELTKTSYCQPALYLHGLIALTLLKERVPGFEIGATAGLSLGEFTAHAAAGTFSFEDGLRLVARRGEFMQAACEETVGSMAALIGGEETQIRELAKACDVDVANLNAPGQIVLSGSLGGIDQVVERAKDFGIRRAIKLNVAGAYHSRLMQSAKDRLAAELEKATIQAPSVPVVGNFTAEVVSEPSEIRRTLTEQVTGSVRWIESIQNLRGMGYTTFIELGPGKVLAGLVAKIDKEAVVHSVEDLASLEKAVEALS